MTEEDEWEDAGIDDGQNGVDYRILSKNFKVG
jgi:hypothetical protein